MFPQCSHSTTSPWRSCAIAPQERQRTATIAGSGRLTCDATSLLDGGTGDTGTSRYGCCSLLFVTCSPSRKGCALPRLIDWLVSPVVNLREGISPLADSVSRQVFTSSGSISKCAASLSRLSGIPVATSRRYAFFTRFSCPFQKTLHTHKPPMHTDIKLNQRSPLMLTMPTTIETALILSCVFNWFLTHLETRTYLGGSPCSLLWP